MIVIERLCERGREKVGLRVSASMNERKRECVRVSWSMNERKRELACES